MPLTPSPTGRLPENRVLLQRVSWLPKTFGVPAAQHAHSLARLDFSSLELRLPVSAASNDPYGRAIASDSATAVA